MATAWGARGERGAIGRLLPVLKGCIRPKADFDMGYPLEQKLKDYVGSFFNGRYGYEAASVGVI